jgi:hypothetical protein
MVSFKFRPIYSRELIVNARQIRCEPRVSEDVVVKTKDFVPVRNGAAHFTEYLSTSFLEHLT